MAQMLSVAPVGRGQVANLPHWAGLRVVGGMRWPVPPSAFAKVA